MPNPEGVVEVADCVTEAIGVVEKYIQNGSATIPNSGTESDVVIADVGFVIQQIAPGIIDEVSGKLKILNEKIAELDKKTKPNFDDFKKFITDKHFSVETMDNFSSLKNLMSHCLTNPDEESVNNFRDVYKKTSPLTLTYTLSCFLRQKFTNPMNIDINKWKNIMKALFGEFLLLERFASGMLKSKNSFDWDRILEHTSVISEAENSKADENWAAIAKYFEENKGTYTKENKKETCLKLKEKLNSFWTTDTFCVAVFNAGTWNQMYAHMPRDDLKRKLVVFNRDIIVLFYRCRKAYSMELSDFENMDKELAECKKQKFSMKGTVEDLIKEQIQGKNLVRGDKFVCLIDNSFDPVIQYTTCSKHGKQPGVNDLVNVVDKKTSMQLIIALP